MIRITSQNLRPNPKDEPCETAMSIALREAYERKKQERARRPEPQEGAP